MTPDSKQTGVGARGIDRRSVLRLVGGSAVGLAAATGPASAWTTKFYGCSQVCSDSRGSRAVVATADGFECRPMPTFNSNRQNQSWGWESACYEASDGESIVGIVESCQDHPPVFCVNPNNCTSNKYDSVDAILDHLNDGDCCSATIVVGTCDASGTGNAADGKTPDANGASGQESSGTGPSSGDRSEESAGRPNKGKPGNGKPDHGNHSGKGPEKDTNGNGNPNKGGRKKGTANKGKAKGKGKAQGKGHGRP